MGSCLGLMHNVIKIQTESFRNHPLHPWHSLRPSKYTEISEQLVNFLFTFRYTKGKRQECHIIYHPLLVKEGHVIVTAGKAFVFRIQGVSGTSPVMEKTHSNLAFLCCGGHLEMYRFLFIELI